MSCPVNLQALPSRVLEEVFTSANIRGRPAVNSLTTLTFPKSRCALWDGSPAGEKLRLQFCSHGNLRLVLSEKALHLALRHARHVKKPRLLCFLLGSVSIDSGEQNVTLTLDRFDPGRDQPGASGRVPMAPLPGDVLVPCLFSTERAEQHGAVQSQAEVHQCLKSLHQTLSSRHPLDLSQLIKVRGHVWCSQRLDAAEFSLGWSAVCPSTAVHAHAIRPLPIIPTALLRSLTDAVRPLHAAGRHRGFVTMDQTRKLLLLLESDPKACSLPLVGLWVSGVTHVSNPQVWAWCLRFLFGSALQDRVFSESGSFLLLVFSSTHRHPQFFQCQTQSPQLDFQLLSSSQCATLFQGALVDGRTLQCELRAEGPSGHMDVFRDALTSFSSTAALSASDQDSGVGDDDLSPRPSPSPHLPPQQACRVQPSVPELSLLIDSNSSTNHSSMQAAGPAHSPPAGETEIPPPLPPPPSSSSEPRAPPLHSTPNSNLSPLSCCCPPITPSSPHHTPPSKPQTPPPISSNQHSAPPPPPSWSMDSPSCPTVRRCDPPEAEVLPSEAYRLLLLQDQQLRLLQAQVQTLLETQKKLQTNNQTSRNTACVSTAMGASLFWAEPQEVQAPPPVSHKLPSSSSSSLSSSRDTSLPSGPSPPSSPLLSVSMCRPEDEPQDFYQNLMSQLTSRLQKENEREEPGGKVVSPCSSSRKKARPPVENPVLGATVRRLQPLGVDVDPNRKRAPQSTRFTASISPAAALARLSVTESGADASVDRSLEANTFMLKHLNDATLSRLGGSAPSHDPLPSANNMSLATRKYCKRYSLIQEEDDDDDEEDSYSPLTNTFNTKPLPQRQLIRELRPKMKLLAADKENREPGRRRNPEGSVGNILDLSRLRQLPKLF